MITHYVVTSVVVHINLAWLADLIGFLLGSVTESRSPPPCPLYITLLAAASGVDMDTAQMAKLDSDGESTGG